MKSADPARGQIRQLAEKHPLRIGKKVDPYIGELGRQNSRLAQQVRQEVPAGRFEFLEGIIQAYSQGRSIYVEGLPCFGVSIDQTDELRLPPQTVNGSLKRKRVADVFLNDDFPFKGRVVLLQIGQKIVLVEP